MQKYREHVGEAGDSAPDNTATRWRTNPFAWNQGELSEDEDAMEDEVGSFTDARVLFCACSVGEIMSLAPCTRVPQWPAICTMQ